jgi:DNA modification methylase
MRTKLQATSVTNAEKRAGIIYSNALPPTNPGGVTSRTSLSELNLNWRERDLPERDRTKHVHRLHPYLGKYIPQLVEIFLRKFFKKGGVVLDPFCGSGTTLVQANELGINSIGYDISAFNVMLARVKTAKYDLREARKEVHDILEKVRGATQSENGSLPLWTPGAVESVTLPPQAIEYLNRWFAPRALAELLTYRNLIESEDYLYKDLLKVILSRSARSSRLTTHFDLDFPKKPITRSYHCYKHSRICKPTEEAFKFLERYSIDTLDRIETFAKTRTDARVKVVHGSSLNVRFPNVDGVLTSPPYVGLIDYHEQHAYAYHLLGLEDKRAEEIGAATNGSSTRAKEEYQNQIARVLRRARRAVGKNGKIIIVANDRANLYPNIAKLANLEIDAVVNRHVNRRTGRRSTEFYESIFILSRS